MVVCPHGSAANNSSLGVVRVDAQFLNSILPNGIEWFNSYLWLVPGFNIDVPAFCSVDPPDPPTLDADDLVALITGGRLGTAQVGIQKVVQLVQHWAWYQMCHCLIDTTPAIPSPQTEPTGAPIVSPGGGTPVVCYSYSHIYGLTDAAGTYAMASWLWHTSYSPKQVRVRLTYNAVGTPHQSLPFTFYFTGNGASPVYGTESMVVPPDVDKLMDVPEGATELRITYTTPGATTDTLTLEIFGYCGDVSSPISPTDPGGCCAETQGLLYQIYNLLTIQQRYSTPFAYIRSTEHAGLTDTGTISVQGLVGLQVQITTLPAYLGEAAGTPVHIFDGGWVQIGTEDGYGERRRVDSVAIVWLPASMPAATVVAYTFPPGLVARVTELKAEP